MNDQRATPTLYDRDEWGFSPYLDLVLPALLGAVGDVRGRAVLDACCGEGYVARMLASRGATVVGVDPSKPLIEVARRIEALARHGIDYLTHDLLSPLDTYRGTFDLITCNLGLSAIADYERVIASLGAMLRPDGSMVVALHNPYAAVVRQLVADYFDTGPVATAFHRTLEDYTQAFSQQGLLIRTLVDVRPNPKQLESDSPQPSAHYHFPNYLVLELIRGTPSGSLSFPGNLG